MTSIHIDLMKNNPVFTQMKEKKDFMVDVYFFSAAISLRCFCLISKNASFSHRAIRESSVNIEYTAKFECFETELVERTHTKLVKLKSN